MSEELSGSGRPRPKRGPGSRRTFEGQLGAAAELERRKAARAAEPEPTPEPETPADAGEPGADGGFAAGLREGAAKGRSLPARGGSAVADGSGIVLGFLAWVWVVLPYLHGGPSNVRNVLKAKFTNQAPDGSDLP